MLTNINELLVMERKLKEIIESLNVGEELCLGMDKYGYPVTVACTKHPSVTKPVYKVDYKNSFGDQFEYTYFHKSILKSAYEVIMNYQRN